MPTSLNRRAIRTDSPGLARLQTWFCRVITTPESKFETGATDFASHIAGGNLDRARERMKVYVRDYWARCIDSLHEDFPGLAHILGRKKFNSWMEQYVTACPSRSYTLRNLGARLKNFMRDHYRGKNKALVLDMIRFEWAKIESFDQGADSQFDPARLDSIQKSDISRMRLSFQPHVSLLELDYPVFDLSDRLRAKNARATKIFMPRKKRCHTVVYRRDGVVHHREIERPFFLMLMELQKGATLARTSDLAVKRLNRRELSRLEKNAQSWFQLCVSNRWLRAPGGTHTHERTVSGFAEGDEFSVQNRLVAAPPRPPRRRIRVLNDRQRQTV